MVKGTSSYGSHGPCVASIWHVSRLIGVIARITWSWALGLDLRLLAPVPCLWRGSWAFAVLAVVVAFV